MYKLLILFTTIFLLTACSRKVIPGNTTTINSGNNPATKVEIKDVKIEDKNDTITLPPPIPAPPAGPPVRVPEVITVNDAAAKKSVDGRLYYDLNGKRYWKNYKDGKYYIFNKNMTGNPDYKPRN